MEESEGDKESARESEKSKTKLERGRGSRKSATKYNRERMRVVSNVLAAGVRSS
jgi:hypothetical protein